MAHPSPVDPDETIAEALPHLFREVLDGLAHLEQLGARGEAARLRSEAIAGYSRAWDPACQKRLEQIRGRIERAVRDLEQRHRLSVA